MILGVSLLYCHSYLFLPYQVGDLRLDFSSSCSDLLRSYVHYSDSQRLSLNVFPRTLFRKLDSNVHFPWRSLTSGQQKTLKQQIPLHKQNFVRLRTIGGQCNTYRHFILVGPRYDYKATLQSSGGSSLCSRSRYFGPAEVGHIFRLSHQFLQVSLTLLLQYPLVHCIITKFRPSMKPPLIFLQNRPCLIVGPKSRALFNTSQETFARPSCIHCSRHQTRKLFRLYNVFVDFIRLPCSISSTAPLFRDYSCHQWSSTTIWWSWLSYLRIIRRATSRRLRVIFFITFCFESQKEAQELYFVGVVETL